MSIYEYDAEKHMRQEKEESWEEGHRTGLEEGHRTGLAEGRKEILLEQIKKKMEKGLTPEAMADVLEEDEETIRNLIEGMKRDKL